MISSNMHKLKHSFHLDVKRRLLFFALWTAYHKAMLNKEIINQSDAERLAFAGRIRQAISSLGRGGKTRIAEKCGVSPQAVTGWEKNGRVDKKNLAVIAESAGYSLTWLITGQGQKNHIDGQPTKPSIESNVVGILSATKRQAFEALKDLPEEEIKNLLPLLKSIRSKYYKDD